MTPPWRIHLAFAFVATLAALNLNAQVKRSIADRVSCTGCTITLERPLIVGRSSDSVLLTPTTNFAVDGRNRVYASPTHQPGKIAVFESSGTLTHTLGRAGRGPGELGRVARMAFVGDRLYVLDWGVQRLMIFSPDFTFQEAFTLTGRTETGSDLLLYGDQFVYSTPYPGANRGTIVVAKGGTAVADNISAADPSLGGAGTGYIGSQRRLADGGAGRFWAAHINMYVLELWSLTGSLEQVLTRHASWFEPWASLSTAPWQNPTPAMISTIWRSPDGLLWVAITVPKKDWKAAPAGARVGPSDMSDYVDTMVEVIDPATATLVVSQRFPGEMRLVGNNGHMGSFKRNPDGVLTWSLSQMRLVRPSPVP